MPSRLLYSIGLVFAAAASAPGQVTITLNPVQIAGEVVDVSPRSVVVKAGDGKNWTLHLSKETRLKVTGTAVPEMITPRVCVRFIASIDKKTCKAQDKIDKITIFTPTEGVASRTLGVELAKDAAKDEDEAGGPLGGGPPMGPPGAPPGPPGFGGPGRGPGRGMPPGRPGQGGPGAGNGALDRIDPGAADASPDASGPKRRGAAKNAAASVPDVASYEVCAQVQSFHGRRLTATVQNRFFKPRVMAELAPDAQIVLDLSDLSLVKPGDKVSAQGFFVKPGQCELTEKLIITLANPVGAKPGHARRAQPEAKADAKHAPTGKAKPKAVAGDPAPADNADPLAPDDKAAPAAPAAEPALPTKELPRVKDGGSFLDDPDAKPASPDAKPAPTPAPKPEEAKPEPQKPSEPGKKPADKDDEKDVFDK